jgi:hypothetical protein
MENLTPKQQSASIFVSWSPPRFPGFISEKVNRGSRFLHPSPYSNWFAHSSCPDTFFHTPDRGSTILQKKFINFYQTTRLHIPEQSNLHVKNKNKINKTGKKQLATSVCDS